jgi:quinol monooxygenase YgiN
MSDKQVGEIQGVARFTFHEGKVEEFKRLCAEFMDIVRAKDTGTLQFETYLSDDESECVIYERYRDSDAVIDHGAHVGESCRRSSRQDRVPARSLASRAPSSPR